MALDISSIISGAIGSLIAVTGSIVVAFLYIRNQNQREKSSQIMEQIQKTYIENGILPLEEAIQEYSMATMFAIMDMRNSMVRYLKISNNPQTFEEKLVEISKRPSVEDMLQRNFSSASDAFPYVRRLGNIVYGTTVRVLQNWAEMTADLLDKKNIMRNIKEAGIEEVEISITSVGKLVQESQLYLQKRLDNLKDYIWENEYNSYTDFLNTLESEEYKEFLKDLEGFNMIYTKFMDAMKSPSSDPRIEFGKEWNEYIKTIDENPFKRKS